VRCHLTSHPRVKALLCLLALLLQLVLPLAHALQHLPGASHHHCCCSHGGNGDVQAQDDECRHDGAACRICRQLHFGNPFLDGSPLAASLPEPPTAALEPAPSDAAPRSVLSPGAPARGPPLLA
jgi:hypothetical protein